MSTPNMGLEEHERDGAERLLLAVHGVGEPWEDIREQSRLFGVTYFSGESLQTLSWGK